MFSKMESKLLSLDCVGGHFTIEVPDVHGKVVFEKQFKDCLKGAFDSKERKKYLHFAAKKIKESLQD